MTPAARQHISAKTCICKKQSSPAFKGLLGLLAHLCQQTQQTFECRTALLLHISHQHAEHKWLHGHRQEDVISYLGEGHILLCFKIKLGGVCITASHPLHSTCTTIILCTCTVCIVHRFGYTDICTHNLMPYTFHQHFYKVTCPLATCSRHAQQSSCWVNKYNTTSGLDAQRTS